MRIPRRVTARRANALVGLVAVLGGLIGVGRSLQAEPIAHYRPEHGAVLNDPHVTPGATYAVGVATVCRPGYATAAREVDEAEKIAVYREYGIDWPRHGDFEVDHLIPLELGGSNAIANLWPEPNDRPAGYANSKDRLEDALHTLVCAGEMALVAAQRQIASNWVLAYRHRFRSWPVRGARADSGVVAILRLARHIQPGRQESLTAQAPGPALPCTLEVILPSGRRSTAAGIDTAVSGPSALVSWHWRVGADTAVGIARVAVRCLGWTDRAIFAVS